MIKTKETEDIKEEIWITEVAKNQWKIIRGLDKITGQKIVREGEKKNDKQ